MPKVSVIVPLYNKEKTVARTVNSILEQTFSDFQLIIVDDGSTDNGCDIVRQFDDDRIVLLQQSNKGPGSARNAGIEKAKGQYLAFLDSDDQWYPWYLANAVEAIENNDVGIVGTTYYEWPKKTDMTGYWARRGVHEGKYFLQGSESPKFSESLIMFFHVGNSLVHTDIVRKYGGFYDKYHCKKGEDTFFFMRIVINEPVMIIGPPAVRHHREESGLSNMNIHPLAPVFTDAKELLDSCVDEKRDLLQKVIVRLALLSAHHKARNGFKQDAIELLNLFPESKEYKFKYCRCRCEIALSRILPWWVRFRCAVGPPVRLFLKNLGWKLHLLPRIPDDNK